MPSDLLSIRETCQLLGVSIDTLRRWDASGKLPAIRAYRKAHRQYKKEDINAFMNNLEHLCKQWVLNDFGIEPSEELYCSNSSLFKIRLDKMDLLLGRNEAYNGISSFLTSVAGEIGNNSFDHNIGNWPDIPGVFFGYDLQKRIIVLADRGRGILHTLRRVRPMLDSHEDALQTAFTEIVTGRAPEHRGNGLKFVLRVVQNYPLRLRYSTGDAMLQCGNNKEAFTFSASKNCFRGCMAIIEF